MSRRNHLQKLIINLNRRLQILEERKALHGLDTPPGVLTEIEDLQAEIEQRQSEMDELEAEESSPVPPTARPSDLPREKVRQVNKPPPEDVPPILIGFNEPPPDVANQDAPELFDQIADHVPATANQEQAFATPLDLDEVAFASEEMASMHERLVEEEVLAYTAFEDTAAAVEAERHRLAALLQSDVVTSLRLLLSQANAQEQTLRTNPAAHGSVFMVITLARQALQQVHDLANDLYPTILETQGLEQALEAIANQKMRAHGLEINLALERMTERLPPPIELALFRAAQEALDRAIRQARASHVTLRLTRYDEQVALNVIDDGIVVTDQVPLPVSQRRLEQLGGTIKTDLNPHGGFEITITFTVAPPPQLTNREMEVLQWLVEGLSNKEIAQRLSVTPRTVNFHLDNVYSKLGVNSRTEAAIYALRQGWVGRSPQA